MNKNIEKEYKILVTEKQFNDLLFLFPNAEFQKQVNTYYDTEDYLIRRAKGAMRIRSIANTFIFTLKLHREEGLLEYECEVEDNNSSVFLNHEIQTLLMTHGLLGDFLPLATLTTYRAIIDNGFAELCFDRNEYNGQHDFELEYEYKKEHDGLTYFNEVLAHIGLHYEKNCESKIKRALTTKS